MNSISNLTMIDFLEKLNNKFPPQNEFSFSFSFTEGEKYFKIVLVNNKGVHQSSYAFVSKATGDLFKAASWSVPAKHAQGNVNDETGLKACQHYGVERPRNSKIYRKISDVLF